MCMSVFDGTRADPGVKRIGLQQRLACKRRLNSVLSNVPNEINFDNSHCEINSIISL